MDMQFPHSPTQILGHYLELPKKKPNPSTSNYVIQRMLQMAKIAPKSALISHISGWVAKDGDSLELAARPPRRSNRRASKGASLISAVHTHALCMHMQRRLDRWRRGARRLEPAAHRRHLAAHTLHTRACAGSSAARADPWKVFERTLYLSVTGSFPRETRSSHTPRLISRFDPRAKASVARFWDSLWDSRGGSRRAGALAPVLTCTFSSGGGRI